MLASSYDPDADAIYISLADPQKHRILESEEVSPGVILDFTEDGRVVGIEVLTASKVLAPGDWQKAPLPGAAKAHAAE